MITEREAARSRYGFTLIELMIVVTIIATVAAIAIPNLLQSRISANECSAIASLRTYCGAQTIYILTDYDFDGQLTYADDFRDLYYTAPGGTPLGLIGQDFADAGVVTTPLKGYYFENFDEHETLGDFEPNLDFGLAALPASYGTSGRNTYIVDAFATVSQKDRKNSDLFDGEMPDTSVPTAGWINVSQQ